MTATEANAQQAQRVRPTRPVYPEHASHWIVWHPLIAQQRTCAYKTRVHLSAAIECSTDDQCEEEGAICLQNICVVPTAATCAADGMFANLRTIVAANNAMEKPNCVCRSLDARSMEIAMKETLWTDWGMYPGRRNRGVYARNVMACATPKRGNAKHRILGPDLCSLHNR